ncbi:MAG: LCP family protein [Caldicoprobacteraceae bacterium]|jgi:LCP family protein required for cell wall assembly
MKKRAIWIIVILFLLSGIVYVGYTIYQIMNPESLFEPQEPEEEDVVPQPEEEEEEEEEEPPPPEEPPVEEYRFDEKRLNLLLLGLDASVERYEVMRAFRTDTIILISIDFENQEVYMISIPRDSYVKIPGRKNRDRINSAFVWGGGFDGGGFERTIETVSDFLGGVPIHYYAAVDMNVFKEIIDIMGGVMFDVDVPVKMAGRELKTGLQRLNGQQVLDYCRNRRSPRGDIDRIERQQKMVLAIFDQLKTTEQLLKVGQYYQAISGKVYTNLNVKQIAALGVFALKLDFSQIHTYSIPGDFLNIDGISYWGVNQYKKRDMIKEIFGTEIKVDPKDDIKYIKKQLEEERKALEAAIRDANGVINSVRQLMTDYADYVMQNEKVAVDLHIKKVQQAIEEEDRDAVNATAKELKDYADKLAQTWDQRKQEAAEKEEAAKAELEKARNNAVSTINWVKSEMEKRKDKISQEDREILNNLINGLEGVVNGQDKNAIITKTNDLTSKANEVFAKAEPSEDPQEEGDSTDGEEQQNEGNNESEG